MVSTVVSNGGRACAEHLLQVSLTILHLVIGTESWKMLCRLRREKIASEEKIAVLIAELAESEDSVNERERAVQRASAVVADLTTRLSSFRRHGYHS